MVYKKLCLLLAVILWKCQFIIAARSVINGNINVCENATDHIFVQDIKDCSKYFVCVNGQAIPQQCNSNLYFDAKSQACTASRQACFRCPPGQVLNLPLSKTCDKYILCYYGEGVLRKCENNQQFNTKTGKCDLAQNVDCVENRCSIYVLDTDLMYVPSASSCENYYICMSGQAKLLNCAEGLYFSTKCNCCDRSENVKCLIEDYGLPNKNTKKKRNHTDDFEPLHTPTLIGETDIVKCPPIGRFLYEYIEDPVRYFTCINGKAKLYACASGLQFDNKLKRCVSQKKLKQLNTESTEINSTEREIGIDLNQDFIHLIEGEGTENQTPAVLNEPVNIICPSHGGIKFAHKEKNKFYLCVNGMGSILACAQGSYFESETEACRRSVDFENEISETTPEMQNSTETIINFQCPFSGIFVYPHVENNLYYVCLDGKSIALTCPEDKIFNAKKKTCQTPTLIKDAKDQLHSVLDEMVDIICPATGVYKFPHVEKNKFYLCINGMGSVFACSNANIFNTETSLCERKPLTETVSNELKENKIEIALLASNTTDVSNIHCPLYGTSLYPDKTYKQRYFVCLDGSLTEFTCPKGLIFDSMFNACRKDFSEVNDNACPENGTIKLPHKDRNKFYLCIDGLATTHSCAKGDFFDAETKTCRETFASENFDS